MTQRDDLVRLALGEVGKPYSAHRDCSGLTAWLYRQIGITIPEGSVAQFGVGEEVPTGPLQPGDLLFFDTFGPAPGHVALYIGNQQFVHAFNEQKGIRVNTLRDEMGGPYMGARRILAPADSPIAPTPVPIEDSPRSKRRRRRRNRRQEAA